MKNILVSIVLCCLLLFLFSSCGIIFGGSRYNALIMVKDHPNARLTVNGVDHAHSKVLGSYKRNRTLVVEVNEEGCETKTQAFGQAFRTANFILSLATWGMIGIGIDLATGASFKPDHLHNPLIEQVNHKNFIFTVDYPGCPVK